MSNHIPGIPRNGLTHKKWFVELVSSGPPVVAAGGASLMAYGASPAVGTVLGLGVAWLLGASTLKVVHAKTQDQAAAQQSSHDGLIGGLYVLQKAASHVCGIKLGEHEDLRVTVHRVVPPLDNPEFIEQIVPYVGGRGSGAGRTFSVRSGITGAAIRLNKPVAASRVSGDEAAYREELKSTWSYTEKESKSLSADRQSFMAIPISGKDHVRGVVYLDSNKPGVFGEGTAIANALVAICSGVNQYCNTRYGE
jgi:hypothetical protein